MALLSVAVLLGWLISKALKLSLHFTMAWFTAPMLAGLLVQLLLNRTKWADIVDKPTMSHIQGISLEFLVAGAVASVNVSVIVEYATPLIIGDFWRPSCLFGRAPGFQATYLVRTGLNTQ